MTSSRLKVRSRRIPKRRGVRIRAGCTSSRSLATLVFAALSLGATSASAEESKPMEADASESTSASASTTSSATTPRKPKVEKGTSPELFAFEDKPGYFQLQAQSLVGTGLRFNNPYRLATVLGETAESVSRTPVYLDLGAAVLFGGPTRFQHGAQLGFSIALEGVRQAVFTPSYVLARRRGMFAVQARVGTPIVLTPDVTVGGELALAGTWFFRAALGLRAEVVGDVFYGAGTVERKVPAYPMLSFAAGLVVAYEVLP